MFIMYKLLVTYRVNYLKIWLFLRSLWLNILYYTSRSLKKAKGVGFLGILNLSFKTIILLELERFLGSLYYIHPNSY